MREQALRVSFKLFISWCVRLTLACQDVFSLRLMLFLQERAAGLGLGLVRVFMLFMMYVCMHSCIQSFGRCVMCDRLRTSARFSPEEVLRFCADIEVFRTAILDSLVLGCGESLPLAPSTVRRC